MAGLDFYFYTDIAFEDWDYNNAVKQGIGGSETSIVEMSWRLAEEGHNVTVYAPIKKSTKPVWRGVKYKRYEEATFNENGIWILYRVPQIIDKFTKRHKGQILWLLWQDWDYPTLTKERSDKVDHHITLCKAHGRYMIDRYPFTQKKLWLSSNGIKRELIEEIEKEKIKRDPFRVMYASSPDRGLKSALQVIKKAREYEPRINFHAFYGFNNLDKLIKGQPDSPMAKDKDEILSLLKQKNVFFHGRINQKQLMREWFKSSTYLYITNFFETSHISGMEAQACGAIPVFSPIFAQKENIRWGMAVEGAKEDPLTIAKAAGDLVKLVSNKAFQEETRPKMMEWARGRFEWDNFVYQWECEATNNRKMFEALYEFPTQI